MARIFKKKRLELQYKLKLKKKKTVLFSSTINLDIQISRLVITGAVASGKSSLLNIIAGIISPTFAKVSFAGQVFTDTEKNINLPLYLRNLGYLWQKATLFPHLNIKQNLFFAKDAINHPAKERLLEMCEMHSLLDKLPYEISGGEKQKVCLIQTLLRKPNLLLLDEPLSALDLKNKEAMLELLMNINQDFNLPMIYVTHSKDEADIFAEQRIKIDKGEITVAHQ